MKENKEFLSQVKSFTAMCAGVRRDLEKWKNSGELPSEEKMKEEWEYFRKAVELARKKGIDSSVLVQGHVKACESLFADVVPEQIWRSITS